MECEQCLIVSPEPTASGLPPIGYFYFENREAMKSVMGSNNEKLRADIPNYTNIQPVIQVSEVVQ